MPVTPTYPGVYVQEVPSDVRTIAGVSTSTGLFLGRAARGPIGVPVLCLSWLDYTRTFGDDTATGRLAHYVRLFFLNGGTTCWVMRLAAGSARSSVVLRNEAGQEVLELIARSAGAAGDDIRAVVRYEGPHPEAAFTLELFRWERRGDTRVRGAGEVWSNLTMNPDSPSYAPDVLTQNSALATAQEAGGVAAQPGFTQSGRLVRHTDDDAGFKNAWKARLGVASPANRFRISVDGSQYVEVNLAGIDVAGMTTAQVRTLLPKAVKDIVEVALAAAGAIGRTVTVTFPAGPVLGTDHTTRLRITSGTNSDVFVLPGSTADLAAPLMLGTAQGGLEVGAHAARRPAPSGIVLKGTTQATLDALTALRQDAVTEIKLPSVRSDGTLAVPASPLALDLVTTAAADPWAVDATAGSPSDHGGGLREKLAVIAQAINDARAVSPADPVFPWTAAVQGDRLVISSTGAPERDNLLGAGLATAGTDLAAHFAVNTGAYVLGAGGLGLGGLHTPGTPGDDGDPAQAADYDAAYAVVDREVDLFNLMVLAPDGAVPVQQLYGPASVFCQKRRAVLLMDPPDAWDSVQSVIHPVTGVNALRTGLVKDYAALFFPRIQVDDAGRRLTMGPAGAMAGLIARIDATRGVWKAPAGTEADLRGVVGLERRYSDDEHGQLNPRGVNTLRVFPGGIVNYGARTADGDDGFASQWKYLSVRRLASYVEESLLRGLQWVVFEPNDEPLWAQIRLNVGAFLHGLFQRGAFAGPKQAAYFVKCDAETTSRTDRDLGVVNIHIGIAPVKPAEFVVLYLRQIAGQVEV
ncbi:phage tail sheath C-terminal domain-containing protein [Streptomyces sp. NPDC006372]|uniref:phage tail sheath family protein n=1 Tax=Streptomyces sp. NPDC006372 TaxID=3155599 RepID=UPI0033BF7D32